jgi:hypothetical protein
MTDKDIGSLKEALDFKLSEVFHYDLYCGVLAGIVGGLIGWRWPEQLAPFAAVASQLVGVVIGAVLACAAIQAAFLDQAFLRKLRAIGRNPTYYLAPFLFTAVIGVISMILLLAASLLTPTAPEIGRISLSSALLFFTVWTMVSLLPCLNMIVQFIGLRRDALDVPDDI